MRFMIVATVLVLAIIVTVIDADGRHRVRNGIRRRYFYGHQAHIRRRYHQRRTWEEISCITIKNSQLCSRCCAVDGNWGPWSGFNPCSVTCGTGSQSRTRSCDNPAPAYGGADCHGDGIETRSCNMIDCPVDGNWGTWSEFSTCCSVCSVVEQNRSRLCDNPVPAMGGADCPGDSVATKSCNSNDCLDNVRPLCANQSFDVIILIDASANITDEEIGQANDLVQQLYTELIIDGHARRFGFTYLQFGSGDTQNSSIKIEVMPLFKKAMDILVNEFQDIKRTGIRQIGVMITAAETTKINETSRSANYAKAQNISMYAVGIGDRVSEEFVQAISSNPSGAINTGSSQLNETAIRLKQLICL